MSYYTDYQLGVCMSGDGYDIKEQVKNLVAKLGHEFDDKVEYNITREIQAVFTKQWGIPLDEMKAVSQDCDHLITLDCYGEEGGDAWRIYAKRGQAYKVGHIFPAFDQEKLKPTN